MKVRNMLGALVLTGTFVGAGVGGMVFAALQVNKAEAATASVQPVSTSDSSSTVTPKPAATVSAAAVTVANVGKLDMSRDGFFYECCGNNATLALTENTAASGNVASISFHDSGFHEGTLELAKASPRRLSIYDHQGNGMGLQMTGALYVDGTGSSYINGSLGIGRSTPRTKLDIWGGVIATTGTDYNGTALMSSAGGTAYFSNNALGNGLSVAPDGSVGIRTGTPGSPLEVYRAIGNTAADNSMLSLLSDWGMNLKVSFSNQSLAYTNRLVKFTFGSDGSAGGHVVTPMVFSGNGDVCIGTCQ